MEYGVLVSIPLLLQGLVEMLQGDSGSGTSTGGGPGYPLSPERSHTPGRTIDLPKWSKDQWEEIEEFVYRHTNDVRL